MAEEPESHELHIWNAEDLLEDLKRLAEKGRQGVNSVLNANSAVKNTLGGDVVALGQLIQSGAKVARQIKLLGITGRAYIKEVNKKKYIIFKGDAKLRPDLRGTRYLAENAKVRCFVVGGKDLAVDVAKGLKVAVIAFVAIDVIQEVMSDHPSFASLGVQITSDLLQAVVAGFAAAAAGVVLATVGAPVAIAFIGVTVVGFAAGATLTYFDNKLGLTKLAKARARAWEQKVDAKMTQAGAQLAAAGARATQAATSYVKAEMIKADKLYQSYAQMLADSTSLNQYGFLP